MPRISHCALTIFATAQVVGSWLGTAAHAGSADFTLTPNACGPGSEWLCYRFYPAEDDPITWTTFDEPSFEITLNLQLPSDLENWRPINASAAVGGNAQYGFVYPDSHIAAEPLSGVCHS